MAITFPTALDTLTNPLSTDTLDSVAVPHDIQHSSANDAIEALESKVGIDGSLDTSSIDYKIRNIPSGLSAYQVATTNGYVGTEPQWLLSLVGAQGVQGIQGVAGASGSAGANGANGYSILSGVVAPTTQGVDNDLYLDTALYNLYKKIVGTWQLQCNIKGATGPAGTTDHTALTNIGTRTHAQLESDISGKQATLVSATNIKSINGTSLLGSGDLVVSGSQSRYPNNIASYISGHYYKHTTSDIEQYGKATTANYLALTPFSVQSNFTCNEFMFRAFSTTACNVRLAIYGQNATNKKQIDLVYQTVATAIPAAAADISIVTSNISLVPNNTYFIAFYANAVITVTSLSKTNLLDYLGADTPTRARTMASYMMWKTDDGSVAFPSLYSDVTTGNNAGNSPIFLMRSI